mgnify:CR=1 FL=1
MDIDKLIIKEQKKRSQPASMHLILEMVEDLLEMGLLGEGGEKKKKKGHVPKGSQTRDRVLRLPAIMATEISVGQRPSSEDRSQFELWMGNLGLSGGSDSSAVAKKLQAITNFFEHPEENLKTSSIPETLSYLMFINNFVWMLKEFNASVAGFLWEPFLASLFGGDSRQVPTSEGNIADIEIIVPGEQDRPISLKILNDKGAIKGSFSDLVGHFANGGKEMRYVIVVKEQSQKRKTVSGVTFYEFNITPKTFMEWIGAVAHVAEPVLKQQKFTFEKAMKENGHNGIVVRKQIKSKKDRKTGEVSEEHQLKMRGSHTAKGSKARPDRATKEKWWLVGYEMPPNDEHPKGWIQMDGTEIGKAVEALNITGIPADEEVEFNTPLEAEVIAFGQGRKMKTTYKPMPGVEGKTTAGLWGGMKGYLRFSELAKTMEPTQFFKAILGQVEGIQGAPGAVGGAGSKTQFNITPAHYKGKTGSSGKLGYLKITTPKVEEFFQEAAANLNVDLVTMFNALADLTDNIGRFFLVDCGPEGCSTDDASNRNSAGDQAIEDSKVLKVSVDAAVKGMEEGGGERAPSGRVPGERQQMGSGPAGHGRNENKTREDIIE